MTQNGATENRGSDQRKTVEVHASYALRVDDDVALVSALSAPCVISLPSRASIPVASVPATTPPTFVGFSIKASLGTEYDVEDVDGSNTITITPPDGLINGAASYVLATGARAKITFVPSLAAGAGGWTAQEYTSAGGIIPPLAPARVVQPIGSTPLSAAILEGDATMKVVNPALFAAIAFPFLTLIDSEVIQVTSGAGTPASPYVIVRAQNGTAAAGHALGAAVKGDDTNASTGIMAKLRAQLLVGGLAVQMAAGSLAVAPWLADTDYHSLTVDDIPSYAQLSMTPDVVIAQKYATGSNNAFLHRGNFTAGAAFVLSADVPVGALTITTVTAIPLGSRFILRTATGQTGQTFTAAKVTGAGPFTTTLNQSTLFAFPSATSTCFAIADQAHDIRVQGNNALITGSGDAYAFFSVAYRCTFSNLRFDDSQGTISGAGNTCVVIDTASDLCSAETVRSTGIVETCFTFASCSRCWLSNCDAENYSITGFNIGSSNGHADNCTTSNGTPAAATAGMTIASVDNVSGCNGFAVNGGTYSGSRYGVWVSVAANGIDLNGVNAPDNADYGIFVDPSVVPPKNIRGRGTITRRNGIAGILVQAACLGVVFTEYDVCDNLQAGVICQEPSAQWFGGVCIGNANAVPGHTAFNVAAASGRMRVVGLQAQNATVNNWIAVNVTGSCELEIAHAQILLDGPGFPVGIFLTGANAILDAAYTSVKGAAPAANGTGFYSSLASQTLRVGPGCDLDYFNARLTISGPYNRGSFDATGVAPVLIAFPNLKSTDRIWLIPTAVAGVAVANPLVTLTPGTGFSVTSIVGDASTYAYVIL